MDVKKKCVDMSLKGVSTEEIYKKYYSRVSNAKFESFSRSLRRWKRKARADDEILEKGNLSYGFTPHATTVQIGSDGEITQSWVKSRAEDRLYLDLLEEVKKHRPVDIVKGPTTKVQDKMLEIPLVDMHFGITDLEYYQETLEDVLTLIGKCHYEEIYIIIGNDLFHNDDFRGRTSSGREIEKVDLAAAWNDAKVFYNSLVEKSIQHSKATHIVYVKGNHDESMTWAFVQMLKAQYGHLITVDDSMKQRKIITYGANFIGITHGDKGKRRPIDLRSQFTIEFPVEFANSKVREIHASHLHREAAEDIYGIMCRTLSTGNITDEWHNDSGFVGQNKRFMLFEWCPNKLVSIHYV